MGDSVSHCQKWPGPVMKGLKLQMRKASPKKSLSKISIIHSAERNGETKNHVKSIKNHG
jgi:hypothetical protein